jgi:hypothetical protein
VWFLHAECNFHTQSVTSTRRLSLLHAQEWFLHAECDVDTYERDYDSHTLGWMSYVLKLHSACRNHSCVWCSHAYCDEHTYKCNFWTQSVISIHTSVIYISKVRISHAECDFHTQSVTSTRRLTLLHAQEWFLHAERDVDTYKWWHSRKWLWHSYVVKPHSACRNHSCVCDVHTRTVMNTRTSVISERNLCISTRWVWFIYAECDFHTQSVISTHRVFWSDFFTATVVFII